MWPSFTFANNLFAGNYLQNNPQSTNPYGLDTSNIGLMPSANFNTFMSDTYSLINKYHSPFFSQPLSISYGINTSPFANSSAPTQSYGFGAPAFGFGSPGYGFGFSGFNSGSYGTYL